MCVERGQNLLQTGDSHRLPKYVVASFGQEIDLVSKVLQVCIDRRRGKEQDLGPDSLLDDVLHEPLVAAHANDVALLVTFPFYVVAEVVRFVNNDQVEVSPVNHGEVDIAGFSAVAAQVSVA